MIGPPDSRQEHQTAPPLKRANPDGVPVRQDDGTLVAHVSPALAERLLAIGAAEALRRGPRRYLRLRQGINVERSEGGWDVMEFLRKWRGDSRAARYVAHKDRQSERLLFQPPIRKEDRAAQEMRRSFPSARSSREQRGES